MSVPVVRPRRLFVPIEITQAHVAPASAGFRDVFTVVVEFRTNVALDAPVEWAVVLHSNHRSTARAPLGLGRSVSF